MLRICFGLCRGSLAAAVLLVGLFAAAIPSRADELIVDNTDPAVQAKGKWTATSSSTMIGRDRAETRGYLPS